jgi:hypothetical protein
MDLIAIKEDQGIGTTSSVLEVFPLFSIEIVTSDCALALDRKRMQKQKNTL